MKTFATYNGDEITVTFQGSDKHDDFTVHQIEILGVDMDFDALPHDLQLNVMRLAYDLTFDADFWA